MQRTQSFTQLNKILRNNLPNMGKTYQKKKHHPNDKDGVNFKSS